MSSVNKVIIVGRLGQDPEIKSIGQTAVCNFTVATSKKWVSKEDGSKQEKTEWHKITAWRKTAEICGKYLNKGSQVYIEGELQTRSWDAENGEKKYITEIIASNVTFLAGGGDRKEAVKESASQPKEIKNEAPTFDSDEDLPF